MNLCTQSENIHNNHQILSYGKILIDEKELTKKLYFYKNIKVNFIKSIEDIIQKLKEVINNTNELYKINVEMINNYIKSKTNRLMNLKTFNSEKKILDHMNETTNEKNIINKMKKY